MNWLLFRGLAREQRHWGNFPATFEKHVPGAKAHLIDLPGAGTEHLRRSPTTIPAIVEDVRARWLTLQDRHPGPWSVLGMSLGGMVAMGWCAMHPRDFVRLVLVSSSAGNLSPPWKRFGLGILPTALKALRQREALARERGILSMTTELLADPDRVAREWASYAEDRPMQRRNVLRQLLAARSYPAPDRLAMPTLVLAGAGDRLADPSCSRALASHFGAKLVVHPMGGHELALDAPLWLASEVAVFATERA